MDVAIAWIDAALSDRIRVRSAQSGSSASYAVIVPAVTVIRLCPGCVCHPLRSSRRPDVALDVHVGGSLCLLRREPKVVAGVAN